MQFPRYVSSLRILYAGPEADNLGRRQRGVASILECKTF